MTPTLGVVLLPQLLDRCRSNDSGLAVKVRQAPSRQLADLVGTGVLDLALCYLVPSPATVSVAPQYEDDLFLVGPASLRLGGNDSIRFEQLSPVSLVLDPRGHPSREMVEQASARSGTPLVIAAEVEPLATKRALMLDQGLCSIVPFYLFHEEIREGLLSACRIDEPRLTLTLSTVTKAGEHPPGVARLQAIISSMIADEIARGRFLWRAVTAGEAQPPQFNR